MYKFPPTLDVSVFVGLKLQTVCFNANQINLHFSKDVSITAERDFQLASGGTTHAITIPPTNTSFLALMEKQVSSAKLTSETALELLFETGEALIFVDDEPNYEAFHLTILGQRIIV